MSKPKSILELAAEHRDECSAAQTRRRGRLGTGTYKRPIHSDALGVHVSQIPEAMAAAKKHGVTIDFDSKGRPIFENNAQRRKYCKIRGAIDMDGSYGDATSSSYRWDDVGL